MKGLNRRADLRQTCTNKKETREDTLPNLPLRPKLKNYAGSNEARRRKIAEYNRTAHKVADHVNRLIANNPDEIQQYFFASLALDLGFNVDDVRSAISDGGYNGRTLRVTEDDRKELARYLANLK
ncbi:hypothetical protein [Bradyrhizobium cenepequi]